MENDQLHVIVIEDNPGDVDLVRQMLDASVTTAFEVQCVDRLSDGLARIERQAVDCVLLDLTLPDSTGLDTFTKLHQAVPMIPTVILSGIDDEATAVRAVAVGAQDFLFKHELNGPLLSRAIRYAVGRHAVEQTLREKEEQLRQSQKMEAVGSLAAGIAHEFNNLMQAIQGHTTFAMDGVPKDEQPYRDLQVVLSATKRAANLTRQLLHFNRKETCRKEPLNPNDAVREIIELLSPVIGEEIRFEADLDDSVGAVFADGTMLHQALMNLCLNARDAMPSGGRLTVRTEATMISEQQAEAHPEFEPGRYVCILITDTGCGMPPEVTQRIFEPFFTTKEVGQGTGLGLAMVYGVVQQHDGLIDVISEPGSGTTLRIYLPVHGVPSDVCRQATGQEAGSKAGLVLVAEDDEMVRKILVRILQTAGFLTVEAADGEEAIGVFQQHAKDIAIVLLDVVMPKRDGRSAYDRIREMNPGIKAIFCTGYDPRSNEAHDLAKEGFALIQKPCTPEVLLATVRKQLGTP